MASAKDLASRSAIRCVLASGDVSPLILLRIGGLLTKIPTRTEQSYRFLRETGMRNDCASPYNTSAIPRFGRAPDPPIISGRIIMSSRLAGVLAPVVALFGAQFASAQHGHGGGHGGGHMGGMHMGGGHMGGMH